MDSLEKLRTIDTACGKKKLEITSDSDAATEIQLKKGGKGK